MTPLNLKNKKILVVGDLMLDRYWIGNATRISPEAPVPVVTIQNVSDRLGGSGNVGLNLAKLGVTTSILGVVGSDEGADKIERLLQLNGINSYLHHDDSLTTTIKLRVLATQQQLLRCDFEAIPNDAILLKTLNSFESLVKAHDVLVLSDYGKGGLSHIESMVTIAKASNKPIFVDPKGSDYSRYRGVTVITPNRAELKSVVGEWHNEQDLTIKAQNLREDLELKYLLLTRSEEGMTLYYDGGQISIPAQAREVFDVSGAGDTVIAVCAAMYAIGMPIEEVVRIANRAGGIVVGKLGTAPITYDELFEL